MYFDRIQLKNIFVEKQKILMYLSSILSFLAIVLIIGGILTAILLKRPDFIIRGMIWIIPTILSALLLKYDRNKMHCNINLNFENLINFSFNRKIIILIFGILYFFSMLSIIINPNRPWYYFVIISILYVLIFIQIFSKDLKPGIILLEIILILINLTFGVTLKYPYYYGWTDIIGHIFMSKVTYLSGHVIPADLSASYANFPLYHILVAESSSLLGIDLKTSLFIILGFIFAIHIIFVYYLFSLITRNRQLSLLTCLLYSISYIVVFYGAYMITRTTAYVGFIIMLYLVYKSNSGGNGESKSKIYKILAIFFLIFIILVHQVSIVQIVIIMFVLSLCERFVGYKKYLGNDFLILISVMFLTYWFYGASVFVDDVIYSHTRPADFSQAIVKSTIVAGNEWTFLTTNIDTSIFVFFALIAIGYILRKQRQSYSCVFSLFVLATFILYVPNPLQILWQTMVLFRFDRFELLLSPFMAFIMADGINKFYDYLLRQFSIKKSNTTIILIFAIFAFTSVISTATDSKELEFGIKFDPSNYFNNGELEGFNYVYTYIPTGSTLYSDYYTSTVFLQKKINESEKLKIPYYFSNKFPYYYSNEINNIDDIFRYKGYIVIRDRAFNTFEKEIYKNSSDLPDKIYSDYSVNIYLNNRGI